ncbi:hypothetical protein C4F40_08965 [Sphingobacterium sp. Ka21]|uniref:Uncharacterized protein n=1 Tax=Sphingobacterium pedocola TaxID=2082722 RepID=A0ABR9T6A3_9SPHI|nr:hypothetical protein [Sphingobacterium pedocola]
MFKIILSILSLSCGGKIQALFVVKRSPVRWGNQMCLNLRLAFRLLFYFWYVCLLTLAITFRGFAFVREIEAQKLVLLLKFN